MDVQSQYTHINSLYRAQEYFEYKINHKEAAPHECGAACSFPIQFSLIKYVITDHKTIPAVVAAEVCAIAYIGCTGKCILRCLDENWELQEIQMDDDM